MIDRNLSPVLSNRVPFRLADTLRLSRTDTEAEGHDRTSIDLPPVQRELARRVFAARQGRPTVVFLLNGGAVSIAPELAAADAVIEAL